MSAMPDYMRASAIVCTQVLVLVRVTERCASVRQVHTAVHVGDPALHKAAH
jgi:hypothetical protein